MTAPAISAGNASLTATLFNGYIVKWLWELSIPSPIIK